MFSALTSSIRPSNLVPIHRHRDLLLGVAGDNDRGDADGERGGDSVREDIEGKEGGDARVAQFVTAL